MESGQTAKGSGFRVPFKGLDDVIFEVQQRHHPYNSIMDIAIVISPLQ
jgi:hypothetical protein